MHYLFEESRSGIPNCLNKLSGSHYAVAKQLGTPALDHYLGPPST